ncbi:uncharacterized protein BYT42DRAFT_41863 [Radiomyces spectabilis]|uniref:uncharacterized protein n=1 Tax=Radiomyces spectabilis TaxID=64574 RepID=UPI00221FD4D0|nr:uncharacterized protein BYT42DRAFT_41863 [Radiomyces spectabilis]KAI8394359.1 hypothetical protein BYT42DRAFT_41863 [Radiomyces spectabilis]
MRKTEKERMDDNLAVGLFFVFATTLSDKKRVRVIPYFMAGQEFYAVIIICIIVLAAIVCGLGIRIYRRATVPGNPTSIQQEWQPMDSMFSPSVPTPDTHEINDRTIGTNGTTLHLL